jgi:hypothetical protein
VPPCGIYPRQLTGCNVSLSGSWLNERKSASDTYQSVDGCVSAININRRLEKHILCTGLKFMASDYSVNIFSRIREYQLTDKCGMCRSNCRIIPSLYI